MSKYRIPLKLRLMLRRWLCGFGLHRWYVVRSETERQLRWWVYKSRVKDRENLVTSQFPQKSQYDCKYVDRICDFCGKRENEVEIRLQELNRMADALEQVGYDVSTITDMEYI